MKLHFSLKELEPAIEEVRTAKTADPLYGAVTGKGFWLIGDQGVYLSPNTHDGSYYQQMDKTKWKRLCIFARECDPEKLDFDTCWNNKRASFGGDDGVEFIEFATIEKLVQEAKKQGRAKYLVIDISPKQFSLSVAARR
jgi:hypothetical protein